MIKLFTSESVTEGHPDKICDQISDAVLDSIIAQDKNARVACECCVTENFLLIMGEISTDAVVDVEKIARETIKKIGYTDEKLGFDYKTCKIKVLLNKQSADIALGVDNSSEYKDGSDTISKIGAGDQGMMFGYANSETEEYMPLALSLSHALTKKLSEVRKQGVLDYLRPDGKSQVTVKYVDNEIHSVDTVVVSTQHAENVDIETLRKDVKEKVIDAVIDKSLLNDDTKYIINPTGRFEIGGPKGDSGLTGRKIVVDTYGGYCAHGGGAFSGKDPTKVDRSAAYMARYAAKNIVASGLAKECVIEVAYAIGVANPVSLFVNAYNTSKYTNEELAEIIKKHFDFRPQAIIDKFELLRPIYSLTSSYGHFGKAELPWERLDMVSTLRKYVK